MSGARHPAIDAVRGAVMVVMALDHVRDFVHADAMQFAPEDLSRADAATFLTRWITHVCAPAFVFLAGVAAQRRLQRDGSRPALTRYLWTRGLWLILLEVSVMRFLLNFRFSPDPMLLIILWALGLSMMALAVLVRLPTRALAGLGLAIVVLHNLLDPVRARDLGAFAAVWHVLHEQGVVVAGGLPVIFGYPVLPWIAVMVLGFVAGRLYDLTPARRQRRLVRGGVALLAGFLLLRLANVYGDPSPWSVQATPLATALSFLRTTKYPPSLQFLLMTLGPTLLLLAWADRRTFAPRHPLLVIGRVPLFYYVVHFALAHVVASLLVWARYGDARLAFAAGPFPSIGGAREAFPEDFGWPLWVTYLIWCAVVAAMYWLCLWYGRVKRAHPHGWTQWL